MYDRLLVTDGINMMGRKCLRRNLSKPGFNVKNNNMTSVASNPGLKNNTGCCTHMSCDFLGLSPVDKSGHHLFQGSSTGNLLIRN